MADTQDQDQKTLIIEQPTQQMEVPSKAPKGADQQSKSEETSAKPLKVEKPPRTCSSCGVDLTDQQEWCLACGTSVGTRIAATPSLRTPLIFVGIVVLLSAVAIAVALIAVAQQGDKVDQNSAKPAETQPGNPAPPAQPPAASPTPPPSTPTPSPQPDASTTPKPPTLSPKPTAPSQSQPPAGASPVPPAGASPPDVVTKPNSPPASSSPSKLKPSVPEGSPKTSPSDTPESLGKPDSLPHPKVGPVSPASPGSTNGDPNDSDSAEKSGTSKLAWPSGKSAWTVVLLSSTNKDQVLSKLLELKKAGINAGVLKSDNYKSLRPGYLVVFAGQFENKAQAIAAAKKLGANAKGAYPRFVSVN